MCRLLHKGCTPRTSGCVHTRSWHGRRKQSGRTRNKNMGTHATTAWERTHLNSCSWPTPTGCSRASSHHPTLGPQAQPTCPCVGRVPTRMAHLAHQATRRAHEVLRHILPSARGQKLRVRRAGQREALQRLVGAHRQASTRACGRQARAACLLGRGRCAGVRP